MEAVLTGVVNRFLSKIIVSSSGQPLRVSLRGGGVTLDDVEIDVGQFLHHLPVTVSRAFVKRLSIRIPWTALASQPIEVALDMVEIIVALNSAIAEDNGPAAAGTGEQDGARSGTARDSITPASGDGPGAVPERRGAGWLGSLQAYLKRVLLNASLRISNLVIKYISEASVSTVSCQLLHLHTDSGGAVLQQDGRLHKRLDLQHGSFCLDRRWPDGGVTHFQQPALQLPRLAMLAAVPTHHLLQEHPEPQEQAAMDLEVDVAAVHAALNTMQVGWLRTFFHQFPLLLRRKVALDEQEGGCSTDSSAGAGSNEALSSTPSASVVAAAAVVREEAGEEAGEKAATSGGGGWPSRLVTAAWSYVSDEAKYNAAESTLHDGDGPPASSTSASAGRQASREPADSDGHAGGRPEQRKLGQQPKLGLKLRLAGMSGCISQVTFGPSCGDAAGDAPSFAGPEAAAAGAAVQEAGLGPPPAVGSAGPRAAVIEITGSSSGHTERMTVELEVPGRAAAAQLPRQAKEQLFASLALQNLQMDLGVPEHDAWSVQMSMAALQVHRRMAADGGSCLEAAGEEHLDEVFGLHPLTPVLEPAQDGAGIAMSVSVQRGPGPAAAVAVPGTGLEGAEQHGYGVEVEVGSVCLAYPAGFVAAVRQLLGLGEEAGEDARASSSSAPSGGGGGGGGSRALAVRGEVAVRARAGCVSVALLSTQSAASEAFFIGLTGVEAAWGRQQPLQAAAVPQDQVEELLHSCCGASSPRPPALSFSTAAVQLGLAACWEAERRRAKAVAEAMVVPSAVRLGCTAAFPLHAVAGRAEVSGPLGLGLRFGDICWNLHALEYAAFWACVNAMYGDISRRFRSPLPPRQVPEGSLPGVLAGQDHWLAMLQIRLRGGALFFRSGGVALPLQGFPRRNTLATASAAPRGDAGRTPTLVLRMPLLQLLLGCRPPPAAAAATAAVSIPMLQLQLYAASLAYHPGLALCADALHLHTGRLVPAGGAAAAAAAPLPGLGDVHGFLQLLRVLHPLHLSSSACQQQLPHPPSPLPPPGPCPPGGAAHALVPDCGAATPLLTLRPFRHLRYRLRDADLANRCTPPGVQETSACTLAVSCSPRQLAAAADVAACFAGRCMSPHLLRYPAASPTVPALQGATQSVAIACIRVHASAAGSGGGALAAVGTALTLTRSSLDLRQHPSLRSDEARMRSTLQFTLRSAAVHHFPSPTAAAGARSGTAVPLLLRPLAAVRDTAALLSLLSTRTEFHDHADERLDAQVLPVQVQLTEEALADAMRLLQRPGAEPAAAASAAAAPPKKPPLRALSLQRRQRVEVQGLEVTLCAAAQAGGKRQAEEEAVLHQQPGEAVRMVLEKVVLVGTGGTGDQQPQLLLPTCMSHTWVATAAGVAVDVFGPGLAPGGFSLLLPFDLGLQTTSLSAPPRRSAQLDLAALRLRVSPAAVRNLLRLCSCLAAAWSAARPPAAPAPASGLGVTAATDDLRCGLFQLAASWPQDGVPALHVAVLDHAHHVTRPAAFGFTSPLLPWAAPVPDAAVPGERSGTINWRYLHPRSISAIALLGPLPSLQVLQVQLQPRNPAGGDAILDRIVVPEVPASVAKLVELRCTPLAALVLMVEGAGEVAGLEWELRWQYGVGLDGSNLLQDCHRELPAPTSAALLQQLFVNPHPSFLAAILQDPQPQAKERTVPLNWHLPLAPAISASWRVETVGVTLCVDEALDMSIATRADFQEKDPILAGKDAALAAEDPVLVAEEALRLELGRIVGALQKPAPPVTCRARPAASGLGGAMEAVLDNAAEPKLAAARAPTAYKVSGADETGGELPGVCQPPDVMLWVAATVSADLIDSWIGALTPLVNPFRLAAGGVLTSAPKCSPATPAGHAVREDRGFFAGGPGSLPLWCEEPQVLLLPWRLPEGCAGAMTSWSVRLGGTEAVSVCISAEAVRQLARLVRCYAAVLRPNQPGPSGAGTEAAASTRPQDSNHGEKNAMADDVRRRSASAAAVVLRNRCGAALICVEEGYESVAGAPVQLPCDSQDSAFHSLEDHAARDHSSHGTGAALQLRFAGAKLLGKAAVDREVQQAGGGCCDTNDLLWSRAIPVPRLTGLRREARQPRKLRLPVRLCQQRVAVLAVTIAPGKYPWQVVVAIEPGLRVVNRSGLPLQLRITSMAATGPLDAEPRKGSASTVPGRTASASSGSVPACGTIVLHRELPGRQDAPGHSPACSAGDTVGERLDSFCCSSDILVEYPARPPERFGGNGSSTAAPCSSSLSVATSHDGGAWSRDILLDPEKTSFAVLPQPDGGPETRLAAARPGALVCEVRWELGEAGGKLCVVLWPLMRLHSCLPFPVVVAAHGAAIPGPRRAACLQEGCSGGERMSSASPGPSGWGEGVILEPGAHLPLWAGGRKGVGTSWLALGSPGPHAGPSGGKGQDSDPAKVSWTALVQLPVLEDFGKRWLPGWARPAVPPCGPGSVTAWAGVVVSAPASNQSVLVSVMEGGRQRRLQCRLAVFEQDPSLPVLQLSVMPLAVLRNALACDLSVASPVHLLLPNLPAGSRMAVDWCAVDSATTPSSDPAPPRKLLLNALPSCTSASEASVNPDSPFGDPPAHHRPLLRAQLFMEAASQHLLFRPNHLAAAASVSGQHPGAEAAEVAVLDSPGPEEERSPLLELQQRHAMLSTPSSASSIAEGWPADAAGCCGGGQLLEAMQACATVQRVAAGQLLQAPHLEGTGWDVPVVTISPGVLAWNGTGRVLEVQLLPASLPAEEQRASHSAGGSAAACVAIRSSCCAALDQPWPLLPWPAEPASADAPFPAQRMSDSCPAPRSSSASVPPASVRSTAAAVRKLAQQLRLRFRLRESTPDAAESSCNMDTASPPLAEPVTAWSEPLCAGKLKHALTVALPRAAAVPDATPVHGAGALWLAVRAVQHAHCVVLAVQEEAQPPWQLWNGCEQAARVSVESGDAAVVQEVLPGAAVPLSVPGGGWVVAREGDSEDAVQRQIAAASPSLLSSYLHPRASSCPAAAQQLPAVQLRIQLLHPRGQGGGASAWTPAVSCQEEGEHELKTEAGAILVSVSQQGAVRLVTIRTVQQQSLPPARSRICVAAELNVLHLLFMHDLQPPLPVPLEGVVGGGTAGGEAAVAVVMEGLSVLADRGTSSSSGGDSVGGRGLAWWQRSTAAKMQVQAVQMDCHSHGTPSMAVLWSFPPAAGPSSDAAGSRPCPASDAFHPAWVQLPGSCRGAAAPQQLQVATEVREASWADGAGRSWWVESAEVALPAVGTAVNDALLQLLTSCHRHLRQPAVASGGAGPPPLAALLETGGEAEKRLLAAGRARAEAASTRSVCVRELQLGQLLLLVDLHIHYSHTPVPMDSRQSPLMLPQIRLRDLHTAPQTLLQGLSAHYAAEALLAAPQLLGSLEVLLNPTGLLRGISRGLQDLVRQPLQGWQQGSLVGALVGLMSGTTSLLQNVSGSTLASLSGFSGALARLLQRAASSQKAMAQRSAAAALQQLQQQQQQQGAASLPAAVSSGVYELVAGVAAGVAGVVATPMESMQEGAGLLPGMGKGLLGGLLHPMSGALGFVSQVSGSLARTLSTSSPPGPLPLPSTRAAEAHAAPPPSRALLRLRRSCANAAAPAVRAAARFGGGALAAAPVELVRVETLSSGSEELVLAEDAVLAVMPGAVLALDGGSGGACCLGVMLPLQRSQLLLPCRRQLTLELRSRGNGVVWVGSASAGADRGPLRLVVAAGSSQLPWLLPLLRQHVLAAGGSVLAS